MSGRVSLSKWQHSHQDRLHQPGVTQRIEHAEARNGTVSLKKRDQDIAKNTGKKNVGCQTGQIRPAIDKLPPIHDANDLKVKTKHRE